MPRLLWRSGLFVFKLGWTGYGGEGTLRRQIKSNKLEADYFVSNLRELELMQ